MPSAPPLRNLSFSHLGFHVHDLERMRDFYCRLLGFVETDRGTVRGDRIAFLSRDPAEHHQLVLVEGRTAEPGKKMLNQVSFRAGSLEDLRTLNRMIGEEAGVSDISPVSHGNAWALYFRDPEGNRIEVFVDSPWYVEQPFLEPLDLTMSDEEILQETEQVIKDKPGYQPAEVWRRDLADKIEAALGG